LFRMYVRDWVAILAVLGLLFSPQVLRSALSATPDFLAALAVLLACVRYASTREGRLRSVGVLLGLGYLMRMHVIVFLVAMTLTLLLIDRKNVLRKFASLWLGALPFLIVQGLVQVWSGHGFFENAQVFNIWRTM